MNNKNILESKELTFEGAMARIEEIMEALDNKNTTLDESVSLYSESMKLIAFCNNKLKDAEEKIKVVTAEGEKDLD